MAQLGKGVHGGGDQPSLQKGSTVPAWSESQVENTAVTKKVLDLIMHMQMWNSMPPCCMSIYFVLICSQIRFWLTHGCGSELLAMYINIEFVFGFKVYNFTAT